MRAAGELGVHRVVHGAVPGDHLVEVAVAVDAAAATGWAGRPGCRGRRTSRPWPSSTGPMSATRSASGPMLAPRAPAPMSVGAPIRLTRWFIGGRRV